MTFAMHIAARTLWGEARGEGEDGQRAVAHVFVNRVRDGRWGKTLATVCMWPYQFSCWHPKDPNLRQMIALDDADTKLIKFVNYIAEAGAGIHKDPTGGATHYYSDIMPTAPAWVNGATFTAKIGRHRFYRDVR
jgi:N-acetylmuramoyl-L-alanine amidase